MPIQILRETLLTVSSDWPFMVSKDSAADYARYRAHLHAHATREIADALASGRRDAASLAAGWNQPTASSARWTPVGCPGDGPADSSGAVKILMVSWGVPAGDRRRPRSSRLPIGDRPAAGGPRGGGAVRRPFNTDPASHPTTDEVHEGACIATAHDPHEFEFGPT